MSIQAVAWVLEHCDATLGARCLMFAIANHSNEAGENCWASVRTLAHEARISRTSAQKALRRLEEAGEIEGTGTHRRGTTIYRIVGMGGLTNLAPPASEGEGANLAREGGQPAPSGGPEEVGPNRTTEPSEEPSTEPDAAGAALRLCQWLSVVAGEPARALYGESQIRGAEWLLENVDKRELRDAVTWASKRTYWATRVRTAGKLRRAWADLRVEWRAAQSGGSGSRSGSVGSSPDDLRAMAEQARERGQ